MFCVIQEIATKKPNKNGYPKELKSEYMKMSIAGKDLSHYYHYFSEEKHERTVKKAYRISIHHNYRENGELKKKQFVLCTVNYYDLAENYFTIYDWCNSKIEKVSELLSVSIDDIYALVENKINPLMESIQAEFQQTEEYIKHKEHQKIIKNYTTKKEKFAKKYDIDKEEYDRCYDVFGELKNSEYLEKIKKEYKQRKEYEKNSGYYENNYNNYNKGSSNGYSGYCNSISNNYTDNEKETLKQFYRILSKKFHPDANPDIDTSNQMQLLNQLKVEWGL